MKTGKHRKEEKFTNERGAKMYICANGADGAKCFVVPSKYDGEFVAGLARFINDNCSPWFRTFLLLRLQSVVWSSGLSWVGGGKVQLVPVAEEVSLVERSQVIQDVVEHLRVNLEGEPLRCLLRCLVK